MPTAGTADAYKAIRTRLLAFVPLGGGDTLQVRLGGRLYAEVVPDSVVYPFGALTLQLRDTTLAGGFEQAGQLELLLADQREGNLEALIAAGDLAMEALTTWSTTSVGWLAVMGGVRHQAVPRFDAPADSSVVRRRVTADVQMHLAHLSQYAVESP